MTSCTLPWQGSPSGYGPTLLDIVIQEDGRHVPVFMSTHPDRGCEHHPSCLSCPFERCLKEREAPGILTERQLALMVRLARAGERFVSPEELAERLRVKRGYVVDQVGIIRKRLRDPGVILSSPKGYRLNDQLLSEVTR